MTVVPRRMPWTVEDLMRTYLGNAIGLVAVLTSWYGVSGTAVPARSVRWLVVGIAGVIALGTVNGLWLLAGRRAVGERSALVHAGIEELLPALSRTPAMSPAVAPVTSVATDMAPEGALVTVAGGTRYHRSDCQLVVGKDLVRGAEVLAARTPCGVCAP